MNEGKILIENTIDENDAFYNSANIDRLKNAIADMEKDKGQIHEIIEE